MNLINQEKGLTLVELVIGMAISTIILGAITGLFNAGLKSIEYGFNQERVYNEGRKVFNEINNELRYSKITSPALGNNSQVTTVNYANTSRSITNGVISYNQDRKMITINNKNYAEGLVQSFYVQRNSNDIADNRIIINMSLTYSRANNNLSKTIDFSTMLAVETKF